FEVSFDNDINRLQFAIEQTLRAEIEIQFDKINEAIGSAGRAINIYPKYGRSRYIIAKCYIKKGQYCKALEQIVILKNMKDIGEKIENNKYEEAMDMMIYVICFLISKYKENLL